MNKLVEVLTRKKVLDPESITETQLARVLNFFDLTALGIGSTLGVGVYVLAGHVAKEVAGPAVVLSFLIAAVASVFAGLCYAEFGSRVPRAGSAYVYSYVCIGEFVAFVIGWNLILEYVIGSASVAKGLSLYLDSLINSTMQRTFEEIAPIDVNFMAAYFDFFSFGISVLLAAALAFGMKGSATVNNIFTMVNLAVVLFVVIAGSFKANVRNWDLPPTGNATDGSGGFFPFGASGVIQGAATCFYGFVGFDCIATTGEEVRNPQRAIPLAIISSLAVIFVAYFSTATVTTLMVPYYLQDINAPLPHAFEMVGWDIAKWIVTIGGIFGLCASLFGAMFPLPRILYAMASDGIIFKFLGYVNSRFQTPLIGTLLAGLLTGLMAGLFDLKHLVNMMSIGTLLAYTIVAACVLVLRYSVEEISQYNALTTMSDSESDGFASNDNLVQSSNSDALAQNEKITCCDLLKQIYNLKFLQVPTKITQMVVSCQILIFIILSIVLWLCVIFLQNEIKHTQPWAIALVSLVGLLLILSAMSMAAQPNSQTELKFKVPLVPLIPLLSILVNIYLMLMLDFHTWIRFGVWMAVGLPMYFLSVRCGDSLSSNKMHAKANGHITHKQVVTNGHTNANVDEKHGNRNIATEDELGKIVASNLSAKKLLKPKAPSPPPLISPPPNNSDTLSVAGALAALDEVLTKEELMIPSTFLGDSPFSRKISIDTVSNASNVHYEEAVVALIHREDIHHDFDLPPPIIEEQTDTESNSSANDHDAVVSAVNNNVPAAPPLPPSGYFTTPRTKASRDEDMSIMAKFLRSHSLYHVDAVADEQPPPPPSMENFLTFINTSKKPTLNRSKSEPDFVVNTHSANTSENTNEVEENEDNVVMGSKQHAKISNKLNKMFERRSLGFPVANKLTKPGVGSDNVEDLQQPVAALTSLKKVLREMPKKKVSTEEENDINDAEGVVVEEVMKPGDIKKKLNEILRSDPRLTVRLSKANELKDELRQQEDEATTKHDNTKENVSEEMDAKLMHKNLMSSTLKSIKLRKIESIAT